jgi:hypothetical protein
MHACTTVVDAFVEQSQYILGHYIAYVLNTITIGLEYILL